MWVNCSIVTISFVYFWVWWHMIAQIMTFNVNVGDINLCMICTRKCIIYAQYDLNTQQYVRPFYVADATLEGEFYDNISSLPSRHCHWHYNHLYTLITAVCSWMVLSHEYAYRIGCDMRYRPSYQTCSRGTCADALSIAEASKTSVQLHKVIM